MTTPSPISPEAETVLKVLQMAYRKHHLNDDSIGWDELADRMCNALCDAMGDKAFQQFVKKYTQHED